MDSRQVSNVIDGAREIASVEELAGNGIGAVPPGIDLRRFGHVEDGELRPKLECQFGLQSFDLAGYS